MKVEETNNKLEGKVGRRRGDKKREEDEGRVRRKTERIRRGEEDGGVENKNTRKQNKLGLVFLSSTHLRCSEKHHKTVPRMNYY
jgi:hypothetical protein